MSQALWNSVDDYLGRAVVGPDAALDGALAASAQAGLPPIAVSPTHGKLLHILARSIGAKRILEFGTLAGYSTIWLARAIPSGGRVITLESDPKHAEVARGNFARAGIANQIDLKLGAALEVLPSLKNEAPFDLVFIDADKANIPSYFTWSLDRTRRGGLIIVDNVVREGAVVDAASTDPSVKGVRRYIEMLTTEKRVSATAIQTVGIKGYDGFSIALVL
jgi:predicted O-methyltransferase YrrM